MICVFVFQIVKRTDQNISFIVYRHVCRHACRLAKVWINPPYWTIMLLVAIMFFGHSHDISLGIEHFELWDLDNFGYK